MKDQGQEPSKQREQQVQKPQGRNEFGKVKK